jgi:hypothetical protein
MSAGIGLAISRATGTAGQAPRLGQKLRNDRLWKTQPQAGDANSAAGCFHPLAIPRQIDTYFRMILEKADAIEDPFGKPFSLWSTSLTCNFSWT